MCLKSNFRKHLQEVTVTAVSHFRQDKVKTECLAGLHPGKAGNVVNGSRSELQNYILLLFMKKRNKFKVMKAVAEAM